METRNQHIYRRSILFAVLFFVLKENEAGLAMVSARLLVNASTTNSKPKPPFNLKAITLSSTEIKLTWLSSNDVDVQAFTVHYRPTGANKSAELQKVVLKKKNVEKTSLIINKLRPLTNYTFYTRAYNTRSASDDSESITQMTGDETPNTIIPTVMFTPLNSTSQLVSNTLPPEKSNANAIRESPLLLRLLFTAMLCFCLRKRNPTVNVWT